MINQEREARLFADGLGLSCDPPLTRCTTQGLDGGRTKPLDYVCRVRISPVVGVIFTFSLVQSVSTSQH